jgi:hypothetical protein
MPPFSACSGTADFRAGMINFLAYDFGCTWSLRDAMLIPLILAGGFAGVAGFTVEEEGTPFTTLYLLAKKKQGADPSRGDSFDFEGGTL